MSLRIVLDARLWGRTGIGRYQAELCRALLAADERLELLLAGLPAEQTAPSRTSRRQYDCGIYSLREQLLGGLSLRRLMAEASLLHYPHYNVPLFSPLPYVVTVHDLIQFKFPREFGRLKVAMGWRTLGRAVRSAAAICVPSESTQRDLAEAFPGCGGKIRVTPEGVSEFFLPCPASEAECFRGRMRLGRFIIGLAARKRYKNWQTLHEAFVLLRKEFADLTLVSVGQGDVQAADGVRHLGYVSDETLRSLYQAAACMAMPSLYEGFGLPVLEAMACGCPVVCSRGSSLDEIAGPAVTIDPRDPGQLAAGIRTILAESEDARRQRAAAGLRHAAGFTWARTARQMLAIYTEVAAE